MTTKNLVASSSASLTGEDSMLQQHEIKRIESLLVKFHDIFARHRLAIGIKEEYTVELTPKNISPAYSQSLPTPVNLKEDILVELASLHKYGNITTLPFSIYASPMFAKKNPMGTSDYWSTSAKLIISSQMIILMITAQSVL